MHTIEDIHSLIVLEIRYISAVVVVMMALVVVVDHHLHTYIV